MPTISASANPTIDGLVEAVTVTLQLTTAQEQLAKERAAGVSDWLNTPRTLLARYMPENFYQGSMRQGTTVRPRLRSAHDLDMVGLLLFLSDDDPMTPEQPYALVY